MGKIITKKIKAKNRHWKNFIDKNYLGSHNLETGEEMLLTIKKFEGEEDVQSSDGSKSKKPVLYFLEDVPKMIMNITNGNTIASLYGNHPDAWAGKQIQVYSVSGKWFGKTQEALRVRDFIPKINVNVAEHKEQLDKAKNLEELATIWKGFPASVKSDKDVENYKNELKGKFTK